jgi:cell division protein FtsA
MRNITAGIDVGTSQIKVVVSELVKEDGKNIVKVLGVGKSESKGMRHGFVVNSEEVKDSIQTSVKIAEKISGIKIHRAYVAVGGIGLSGINSSAQTIVSRADLRVTDLDIEKLNESCEQSLPANLIQNQKILHSIPLWHKLDGKTIPTRNLIDLAGTKLEVKMLFITCLEPHLNDLMEAVDQAGIEVIDCLASPIASSFVTLTKIQKTAGCVLVNIGSETTSIAVFENGLPISLEVFPIGSIDITNDIALGLKVSLEEAENIKIGAHISNYSKKKIDEIISARLSDMFELIENHLKKIGRNGLLPAGIFLLGGGSNVNGVEDFARNILKLPSKLAVISGTNDKNLIKDSSLAIAYGLCNLGFSREEKTNLGIKNKVGKSTEMVFGWIKRFLP